MLVAATTDRWLNLGAASRTGCGVAVKGFPLLDNVDAKSVLTVDNSVLSKTSIVRPLLKVALFHVMAARGRSRVTATHNVQLEESLQLP